MDWSFGLNHIWVVRVCRKSGAIPGCDRPHTEVRLWVDRLTVTLFAKLEIGQWYIVQLIIEACVALQCKAA